MTRGAVYIIVSFVCMFGCLRRIELFAVSFLLSNFHVDIQLETTILGIRIQCIRRDVTTLRSVLSQLFD
jgi:hypothetical protein